MCCVGVENPIGFSGLGEAVAALRVAEKESKYVHWHTVNGT